MAYLCQWEIAKITCGNHRGFRSIKYLEIVLGVRNLDYFFLLSSGWLGRRELRACTTVVALLLIPLVVLCLY